MRVLMEPGFDSHTALIVVDFQNDFAMPHGSLYVYGAERTLPAITQLVGEAKEAGAVVVYTRDWHPEHTPHFMKLGGPWPPHCVANSWGAQFHPLLPLASPAVHVLKGTGPEDGYSGFSVHDPRTGTSQSTGLDSLLRRLGVRKVVVCGLATDYCVKHTALDAVRLGYRTLLVGDAIRAVDARPGDGARALAEMLGSGVELIRERPPAISSEGSEDGRQA